KSLLVSYSQETVRFILILFFNGKARTLWSSVRVLLLFRPLHQGEAAAGEVQHPLPPELPQLGGQGAAVHRQVVGQLLPVQGDSEGGAPRRLRLVGQVGEDLGPSGPLGQVADLPV